MFRDGGGVQFIESVESGGGGAHCCDDQKWGADVQF